MTRNVIEARNASMNSRKAVEFVEILNNDGEIIHGQARATQTGE